MRTVWLALVYFGCVFGAGLLLGPLRVLLLEPRVGRRAAELLEMPVMLAVIALAAAWIARRVAPDLHASGRLGVGVLATALVLAADVAVGVALRGMTVAQVFTERDPVAGLAFYASLAVCALAPWYAGRRRRGIAMRRAR
ncbi:MAG: hypothetical protein BroJett026_01020 [Betaproteobacteria bacterium]|nr:MAG: hypothetical protein BroJett026_01020 [Betaproteobacteria bacterium]